ncbi:MAG TPA: cytochrome c family protein [Bacteroidota bacterium]|nr:cytochrome c family protein [Bacteroidota bacterium]
MKKLVEMLVVAAMVVFLALPSEAQHKYVGVTMCSVCHKTEKQGKQFDIWKSSAHASAFKTLQSPKADEIAKAKGLKVKASEAPECLQCHVTGYAADKALTSALKVEDGIQCESCHGPGSDYKSIPVMKDKAKAEAAGLVLAAGDAKLCTQCHNSKSPSYKEFNYKEAWAKIKHPIPAAG